MTARGVQITNARSQTPKELAIEAVDEGVAVELTEAMVERVVPDALSSGADAPWPGMADESAFLAEQRGQNGAPPAAVTEPRGEETDSSPLPSLDELVQRIPPEARAALDDLFRAKFTGVQRVSKKSFKT
jgi:hypothetical protein